jgi:hypothetical protein
MRSIGFVVIVNVGLRVSTMPKIKTVDIGSVTKHARPDATNGYFRGNGGVGAVVTALDAVLKRSSSG